jgi:hypothetical protein
MEHGIFPTQSVNFIQSALHTPSSFGNTQNHGGVIASDLQNDYHIYSLNWSPFQISFLLDGVILYTYNPAVKDASTWPFDKEQYLLLNIAMGGIAGTIPSSFSQVTMDIDYVRVYQNTAVDTQAPTNFTATLGSVTGSSVELLLNANDNAGTVVYSIAYGSKNSTVSNTSGIQKAVVIADLLPNTSYSFSVTATDLAGNRAANNPILLNATTTAKLGCNGTDNAAQQGSFNLGYKYGFETIGTDVKVTFELLDTDKVDLGAILWKQSPFTETQMTNISGNIFTTTLQGQTIGSTISYACKFAYAGGLSVTKYFSYIVGNNCALGLENFAEKEQFTFQNPAREFVYISSKNNIDKVEIYDLLGKLVSTTNVDTKKVDIKKLSKGIYFLAIYSGFDKTMKKLFVE